MNFAEAKTGDFVRAGTATATAGASGEDAGIVDRVSARILTGEGPINCSVDWKAGFGVQVRTVFPAFQDGVVGRIEKVVPSRNCAVVEFGSMLPLKVNTIGAEADTPVAPLAGTTDTLGAASAGETAAKKARRFTPAGR